MHTPDDFSNNSGLSRETLVEDLLAYMRTLDSKPYFEQAHAAQAWRDDPKHRAGEVLFKQHCASCHQPDHHFTTPKTYDVGLRDERGHTHFNPPSLIGLRFRAGFMHDARFKSLDEVLKHHPQPAVSLTDQEAIELKAFLKQL